jgi:hypothetical protein
MSYISEIFSNSIYWQEIVRWESVKFGDEFIAYHQICWISDGLNKLKIQRYLVFCQDIQNDISILSIIEFASNYPYYCLSLIS